MNQRQQLTQNVPKIWLIKQHQIELGQKDTSNEMLFQQNKSGQGEIGRSSRANKSDSSLKNNENKSNTFTCFVMDIGRRNISKNPKNELQKKMLKMMNSEKSNQNFCKKISYQKFQILSNRNESEERVKLANKMHQNSKSGDIFNG